MTAAGDAESTHAAMMSGRAAAAGKLERCAAIVLRSASVGAMERRERSRADSSAVDSWDWLR
jgi:hypothetical protein